MWILSVVLIGINTKISSGKGNIALGQPSFQSSVIAEGVPGRAVDGDKSTSYFGGESCTHTGADVQPWWAVDLQQPRHLLRINITNRDCPDACGVRLSPIRIGSTATSPATTAPTLDSIAVCASQDSPVGAGETVTFHCGPTERFLVVMLEATQHLTLCEVEVYEGHNVPFNFRRTQKSAMCKQSLQIVNREQQQQMHECFMECFHDPFCHAVNVTSCEKSIIANEEMDFVKEKLNP